MNWVIANIRHIALIFAFATSIGAILLGRRVQKRRGRPLNTADRAWMLGGIVFALISCVVLGIFISR
jgi:hypothetical protein